MKQNAVFALSETPVGSLDKTGPVWIEALRAGVYHTPVYGPVPVPDDKLQRMVKNFNENVRGQEIAVDYDHGRDPAKGRKAAGWYKGFELRPSTSNTSEMSLYAAIEFTEEAKQEIKSGAWKYFSLEWDDELLLNNGNKVQDVIVGGGITNRPVAKGLEALPINFSESDLENVDTRTRKLLVNRKALAESPDPDDAAIKTAISAVQNALDKADDADDKAKLNMALRALRSLEVDESTETNKMSEVAELMTTIGFEMESKEWEHSEPGTGSPPDPRYKEPIDDPGTGQPVPQTGGDPTEGDPAIGGGWRRDPLPRDPSDPGAPKAKTNNDTEGGEMTPEQIAELKKLFKVGDDDTDNSKLVEAITKTFSEQDELRKVAAAHSKEIKFSEDYPEMWAQHQALLDTNRTSSARAFSETVKSVTRQDGEKQVATDRGLSTLALEKVAETHKKFAEGTASIADFEECIKTIVNGGLVKFSESGTAQPGKEPVGVDASTPTGLANARKAFAEKVGEVHGEADFKDKDYTVAMQEAAKRYPELAAAYAQTTPA